MTTIARTITDFISQYQIALGNARENPRISGPLGAFGYDEARFAEGQALLDDLLAKQQAQHTEQVEKLAAVDMVQTTQAEAEKDYGVNRAIAKRLLKDNKIAVDKLHLNQAKPRSRTDLVKQMSDFYAGLLDDAALLAEMAKFGRTQAMLQAALTQVESITRLDRVKHKEMAEAQAATIARNEAWQAAHTWLATLLEVAVFALEDDPQMLEALGITV